MLLSFRTLGSRQLLNRALSASLYHRRASPYVPLTSTLSWTSLSRLALSPFSSRTETCQTSSYTTKASPRNEPTYHVYEVVASIYSKTGEHLDGPHTVTFIDGMNSVPQGLENAARALTTGEKRRFEVTAADAFGEKNSGSMVTIDRKAFNKPGGNDDSQNEVVVGQTFRTEHDDRVYTVMQVRESEVICEVNHALAGNDYIFEVSLTSKRLATRDEVAHGHVHGPGGHHH